MKHTILFLVGLALVACGQAERTGSTQTALPVVGQLPPTQVSVPSNTPVATFVTVLVDISAPTTPTTSSQPLVVSPIVTPTIELHLGGQTLMIEVASTPEQRERGLMFRSRMDANAGMLFVFPNDQNLSFWMRNTQLPLSIAFIDANQRILNIEDMQALDDQNFHLSQGPARYALEVNQGWFATYGVKAGDRIEFMLPVNLDIR